MNLWQIWLSSFGGTGAALLIAGFLSKALYEQWLKKDFKKFERKLNDISKRQEIEFSWLHQERAKVIVEIYGRFSDMLLGINGIGEYSIAVSDGKIFVDLWADTRRYAFRQRLYFDENLNGAITGLLGTYSGASDMVHHGTEFLRTGPKREYAEITTKLFDLLQGIEKEFKTLLAVPENKREVRREEK